MLIDTHCHLDFPEFDGDRDEVVGRAELSGVDYMINVGSSVAGSRGSVELARKYRNVYAAAGIHPHEADKVTEQDIAAIKELAAGDKVTAIGEIGLDYYRGYSGRDNQKRIFIRQMELAKELNLPVVLHSRDAREDTIEIIKEFFPLRAVVHCFSSGDDFLRQSLDLGLFISFTCNITYKKADNLRAMVKAAPIERIMLETDCPYLSPQAWRGKRNEPSQIKLLAEEIAGIKEMSFQQIAQATTRTAKDFFGLPL